MSFLFFNIGFIQTARRLVRQSFSTLISAAFQNLSAGGGSHSLTETVYFTSLSFFGLIGSFHFLSPKWFFSFSFDNKAFPPRKQLSYYTAKDVFRQAILSCFSFLSVILRDFSRRRTRTDGQYQILTALIFYVFQRERLYGGVER